MPLFSRADRRGRRSALGRAVGMFVRLLRLLFRGSLRSGRWITRQAGSARARGAAGEAGMIRLFDLHAVSCAGDTLVAIGLAGTIFFNAPLGEARSKVALYLLVTMVPFALLAPVVGPLLDHFRHGRRYALAATMLGRAFLAWLISDYLHGFGLYPAAFGVLALSRAYGVARSAAVPRLLPEGLNLSQAGARASVYGTVAGAVVAPLGLAAFWVGPQWSLRVASVIFLVGMVISLRLPPRADSEPPESMPGPFRALGLRRGRGERALRGGPGGALVVSTLVGSAALRALYGFLLLFFAFAIKAGDLTTEVLGRRLTDSAALGVIGGVLAAGTFLATAVGTRLRIQRPTAIQSSGLVIVAGVAILTTLRFSLLTVALLALVTAAISGISKLAVDAAIQERVSELQRASAFAHSETVLMLAFVAGGGLGLIPVDGRIGVGTVAGFAVLAAVRALVLARRLREDRLLGRATPDPEPPAATQNTESGQGGDAAAPVAPNPERVVRAERTPPTARVGPTVPREDIKPDGIRGGRWAPPAPEDTRERGRWAPPHEKAPDDAPPGFHIYRPSSAVPPRTGSGDDEARPEPQGPIT
ncbi:MFS transporter [Micromonospora sp. NPDC049559]|uniref:MFS transporter n=1 Tax=Micromonospora sp. NPDC049559 TaxID=3155923 RepID=UPI003427ACCB